MNERAGLTERATTGRIEAGVHTMALRVYYEDTDASGIVYYANYLKFIERARTDLLRMVGITHSGTQASDGVAFTVRRCEIDYRAPARLDDEIEVQTRLLKVARRFPGCSADRAPRRRRPGGYQVANRLSLTLHSSLC